MSHAKYTNINNTGNKSIWYHYNSTQFESEWHGRFLVTLFLGTFSHSLCGFSDSWQYLSIIMGIIFVCHPLCGKKERDITDTSFCKKHDIFLDHVNSVHQNTEFTMVTKKNAHPTPLPWH